MDKKNTMKRGVKIYIHNTNEYFDSIKEAAKELGVSGTTIIYHLSGKQISPTLSHLMMCRFDDNSCLDCGVILNKDNWREYDKLSCYKICKKCHTNRDKNEAIKKYNITIEEYNEIYDNQKGKCAICNILESQLIGKKRNLCIDHNHITKKVRGLLCDKCNRGLGLLNIENENDLEKIIDYLRVK